jgi:hypothetical protein
MIGVASQRQTMEVFVDADLDTLATALYARVWEWHSDLAPLVTVLAL